MSKCIAGLAFAVLNLLATAHAAPVLSYVEKTENFNGRAFASVLFSNYVPGDQGRMDVSGTFSLGHFQPRGRPGSKMTVRSAELVAFSMDDTSDTFRVAYQDESTTTTEPQLMVSDAYYDYFSGAVETRNLHTVSATANEILVVDFGGSTAYSATSAASTRTYETTGPSFQTREVVRALRIEEVERTEWQVCYYSVLHIPYPCERTVTDLIYHKGRIETKTVVATYTDTLIDQRGEMRVQMNLDGNQFLAAFPNFDQTGDVTFKAQLVGDQDWRGAFLSFNYDLTHLVPVWTDTGASTNPGGGAEPVTGSVPEPGSMVLLLLGLAGLGFARVAKRTAA